MTSDPAAPQNPSTSPDGAVEKPVAADELPEQMRIRREKRAAVLEAGGQAYPVEVPRTHS